jgi:hypothetical protein
MTHEGGVFSKVSFSQNLLAKFSNFDHFLGHLWVWNQIKFVWLNISRLIKKLNLFWLGLVSILSSNDNFTKGQIISRHKGGGCWNSLKSVTHYLNGSFYKNQIQLIQKKLWKQIHSIYCDNRSFKKGTQSVCAKLKHNFHFLFHFILLRQNFIENKRTDVS